MRDFLSPDRVTLHHSAVLFSFVVASTVLQPRTANRRRCCCCCNYCCSLVVCHLDQPAVVHRTMPDGLTTGPPWR